MKLVAFLGQAGSGKDTAAGHLVEHHGFVKLAMADPLKRFCGQVFDFEHDQLWGPSEYRNAHDKRYNVAGHQGKDHGWKTAEHNMFVYANTWLTELFGEEGAMLHRPALFAWFTWLSETHPELSPRLALQTLGTEWGRNIDTDLWVNHMVYTAALLLNTGGTKGYTAEFGVFDRTDIVPVGGVTVSDLRFNNEINRLKKVNAFLVRIHRPEEFLSVVGIPGHASEAEQKGMSDDLFDMLIHNDKSLDEFLDAVNLIPTILKK